MLTEPVLLSEAEDLLFGFLPRNKKPQFMTVRRQIGIMALLLAAAISASAADLAILRNGFSIRHERRETLNQVTRLYLGAGSTGYIDVPTEEIVSFEKDTSLPPTASTASAQNPQPASAPFRAQNIVAIVGPASQKHLIDPALITSVIRAESGFNPRAVSPKGAQGLMQLMPDTAAKLGVQNAFEPNANVDGGTRYLHDLLEYYHWDLVKALAAYNAGPQRVAQYGGVPPYRETHAYVARVIRDFNRQKLAEQRAKKAVPKQKTGSRKVVSRPPDPSTHSVRAQSGSGS
jgi:soluble lytic murein transglycosylase-like protein